ncbi:ZPR1 zinc-finger domain-containing protein [Syncephalis plumigaleata]|nr:ZPR1 zinc-finger domain-containing protein [Syncephalis plumigaleata]
MTDPNQMTTTTTTSNEDTEPLFGDIDASQSATELESYCIQCGENGTTRLLLTKIPHFHEVIISAFECPHCHWRNSEIQSAGQIQVYGIKITSKLSTKEDLNRQLVKSDSATVKFVELDLEIPATSRRGALTTVEGVISTVIADLSEQQPVRKHTDTPAYLKIESILSHLQKYIEGKESFTLIIDDPAGNSYVENPFIPNDDPNMKMVFYQRSSAQNEFLGLNASGEESDATNMQLAKQEEEEENVPEVYSFPANCSSCNHPSDTRMHIIDIPYFKEVVIMSTVCDNCGYKSNEVKAGGAVSPQGRRIILNLTDPDDLSRDILKSETCGLSIPEIELELRAGTLGGRFTTVEVYFVRGDSAPEERKQRFSSHRNRKKVTLILDDPMANSYLQNLSRSGNEIRDYDRTWEQNEEWGLNDIKVENYEEDEVKEDANA